MDTAWDAGLRYFDTSPFYGHGKSGLRVGRALADRPRSEFVLSTKVGRLFGRPTDPLHFVRPVWKDALMSTCIRVITTRDRSCSV